VKSNIYTTWHFIYKENNQVLIWQNSSRKAKCQALNTARSEIWISAGAWTETIREKGNIMQIIGRREQLEKKAATILARAIRRVSEQQSKVILGVVGGSSVGRILEILTSEPVDWAKLHLFMLDERAVPVDAPDSNFRLVSGIMGNHVSGDNMHPFIYEPGLPCGGASAYQALFDLHGGSFDIILLSSGEDGHIASLFPDHETIRSTSESFIMTANAPKPPPERMSASKQMLTEAGEALLLFFGEQKQQALGMFMAEQAGVEQCPARLVRDIPVHYIFNDRGGRNGG
jgi:6-phosphogluconolactonase